MTPPTGLTKDAGWQIGVSRTLPLPSWQVWVLFSGPEGRRLWLGENAGIEARRGARYTLADGTTGEVRGYQEGSRIRLTHRTPGAGETTVRSPSRPAEGASLLRFHQERLADSAEREERRCHWQGVMEAVTDAFSPAR